MKERLIKYSKAAALKFFAILKNGIEFFYQQMVRIYSGYHSLSKSHKFYALGICVLSLLFIQPVIFNKIYGIGLITFVAVSICTIGLSLSIGESLKSHDSWLSIAISKYNKIRKHHLFKIGILPFITVVTAVSYSFAQKIVGNTISIPPEHLSNSVNVVTPIVWVYLFLLFATVFFGVIIYIPLVLSGEKKNKLRSGGQVLGIMGYLAIVSMAGIYLAQVLRSHKYKNLRSSVIVFLDFHKSHPCFNLNPLEGNYVAKLDGNLVHTARKINGRWQFTTKKCEYLVYGD